MPLPMILALIQAATELGKNLPEILHGAQQALNPTDQATMRAAIAEWRKANDEAFARVDAKLAAAELLPD